MPNILTYTILHTQHAQPPPHTQLVSRQVVIKSSCDADATLEMDLVGFGTTKYMNVCSC